MIEKAVNLYIGADHAPVVVDVAQYDSQWEYHFRVYYEDQEWEIPEGCTATLVGKKKDGHVALYATTITDNEIVVNPNFQLTACPGDVKAEVRIIAQNGQSVATPRLVFRVAASPEGDEDVASGTTLTAYQELFAEASELMEAASNIVGMTASASSVDTIEEVDAIVTGGTGGEPYNIEIKVPKGERGETGINSLTASATTLASGSSATASVDDLTGGNFRINLGIPRGINGTGAVSSVMGEDPDANTHDIGVWQILKHVYPVGSIYMSTVNTSPATLFGGGTWEPIENVFLLGASPSYPAGEEGGNESVSLTAANNGPHTHNVVVSPRDASYPYAGVMGAYKMTWSTTLSKDYSRTGTIVSSSKNNGTYIAEESGSGEPFSIMPPYLPVYIWERTA